MVLSLSDNPRALTLLTTLIGFALLLPLPVKGESDHGAGSGTGERETAASYTIKESEVLKERTLAAERAERVFKRLATEGPTEEALEGLLTFVTEYPASNFTDEALFRIGEIFESRRDLKGVADYYETLISDFPESPFRIKALFGLGKARFHMGELSKGRALLKEVSKAPSAPLEIRLQAREILDDIESMAIAYKMSRQYSDTPAIGVLLPFRGSYKAFGEAALKGILLAAEVFGSDAGPVDIIVEDIDGEGTTEDHVMRLASNRRVKAIIGPLSSRRSLEAAYAAERIGIPIITLSPRGEIRDVGSYVFRNFLTPREQARAIARYAFAVGQRDFGILYPNNRYGVTLAGHFTEAVLDLGGTIRRSLPYRDGEQDFGDEIKDLFSITTEESLAGRRLVRTHTTDFNIDALYIPEYFDTVSLIAPYLDYYNITDTPLLGSNGWNYKELVTLGGEHLQGAVFVDGFYASSVRSPTANFVRAFRDIYSTEPGIVEGQAFDGTVMAIRGMSSGKLERRYIRDNIATLPPFEGATGLITVNEDGEAVKDLFLLTVEGRRIRELEWEGLEDRRTLYEFGFDRDFISLDGIGEWLDGESPFGSILWDGTIDWTVEREFDPTEEEAEEMDEGSAPPGEGDPGGIETEDGDAVMERAVGW